MNFPKWFPVLLLVVAFILPSTLYLVSQGFLGYDSYYFLAEVCGGNPIYDAPSNAPLFDMLISVLPCNEILFKLLLIALFGASMLIIYAIGEDYARGWGKYTTLFAMISPILLYNSFKFENDAFAFPILFLATYFFLKHLSQPKNDLIKTKKNWFYLAATIFLLLFSLGWWGASIYQLIIFALFEPLLLFVTIPLVIIFFSMILGGFLPRLDVNESNPFLGMVAFVFFLIPFTLARNKLVFNFPYQKLSLAMIGVGLINPKFMILALPFIGLALANAYSIAREEKKQLMLLVATMCIIGFSLPIGLGTLHPAQFEHTAVQDAMQLAFDENKTLVNDWSYGHMVYYYGGETYQRASPARKLKLEHNLTSKIVLTRLDLNCLTIKTYDNPVITPSLKLYRC